jgi:hypothetical protein
MENRFICPECGSGEASASQFVETRYDRVDVWTAVAHRYLCAQCRSVVPAHLGELWDGLSLERAQKEWQEAYRRSQPRWDGGRLGI